MDVSFRALTKCNLCPRHCNANRFSSAKGYCKSDSHYHIQSIVAHHGEEPLISGKHGICNVFFRNCNLQCVYCQNHQISDNSANKTSENWSFIKVINSITQLLQSGCKSIGFVTPSHHIPHVISIIKAFENYSPRPVFVYNTNAYDKVEVLQQLEGLIDIYLPDMKYFSEEISLKYSDAKNYPQVSQKALKEMFRQKGSVLHLMDDNHAEAGLIVRHLVLPGHIDNSIAILRFIAEEISVKTHISLMSQYYPTYKASLFNNINRKLTQKEYFTVVEEMDKLGLMNGWIQEMESTEHYRPDFERDEPFV